MKLPGCSLKSRSMDDQQAKKKRPRKLTAGTQRCYSSFLGWVNINMHLLSCNVNIFNEILFTLITRYNSSTIPTYIYIQVVPGRAGGGSFRRKKNYIAKKEFAYRMCARRPTSAMPKPFLCCERAFCCSMVVM